MDNNHDDPRVDPATGRTNFLDVKANKQFDTKAAFAKFNGQHRPDEQRQRRERSDD